MYLQKPRLLALHTPADIESPVAVEVLSRIAQKHILLNTREYGLTFNYSFVQILNFQLKSFQNLQVVVVLSTSYKALYRCTYLGI